MTQALLKTMSRDQQEWENQFGYERFIHDCISREQYAYTQGEQRGLQQGIEQGIERGIQQGLARGIEQGEYKRALEDARRMLKTGKLSPEEIADITQLSLDEIQQLQKGTSDER